MRIDAENISLPVAVAALGVIYTTAFQFGYFWNVGLEFASLANPTEFVLPLVFSLGLLLLTVVIVDTVNTSLSSNIIIKRPYNYINHLVKRNSSISFFIFIFLALISGKIIGIPLGMLMMIIFTVLAILAFWDAAIGTIDIVDKHDTSAYRKFSVIYSSVYLVALLGYCYAHQFPSRQCVFSKGDNSTIEGTYLRSLGEGHLVRTKDDTLFLSKGTVQKISCKNSPLWDYFEGLARAAPSA